MRIFTYDLKNENMLTANMSMLPFTDMEELKKVIAVALPDVILIKEDVAPELLEYIQMLPEAQVGSGICEVIVLVNDSSTSTIRQWTGLGAKYAWDLNEWEESLIEQYGITDVPYQEERSKRYNLNQPIVIAVGSYFPGAGSTHTALMIGKYLEKNYKANVGIIECAKGATAFNFIKLTSFSTMKASADTIRFTWEKMTLICGGLDAESIEVATRTKQFDYIILDMGDLNHCDIAHLFFKAELPILVGSARTWRISALHNLLTQFARFPQDDVRIVLPSGSKDDRNLVRSLMPSRIVLNLPSQPDPILYMDQSKEKLEAVLSPVLPIKKKAFTIPLFG
jgi:hypothetical protein